MRFSALPTQLVNGPVVVGSGVAGLATALALRRCTVVTTGSLGADGSTPLAQGGVAAAIGPGDSAADHAADIVAVGAGLGDPELAAVIAGGGPAAVEQLVRLGAELDRGPDGQLALGREAGHRAARIVHGGGDATGAAVAKALTAAVADHPLIDVLEHRRVVELVLGSAGVAGVLTEADDGQREILLAEEVILATGGYAHCLARTTNPPAAIGHGVAMAARAGAMLADLELVQFHPTALDLARTPRAEGNEVAVGAQPLPLVTEALRGAGAVVVDDDGRRFLPAAHPDAELAPRDVVARACHRQLRDGDGGGVWLDATGLGDDLADRFPTVSAAARAWGVDPATTRLPITPAAHYCMGGVAVDAWGRTSVRGLWAVGEVASSGLHGANRLASSSLLEGLVMGPRVAAAVGRTGRPNAPGTDLVVPGGGPTLAPSAGGRFDEEADRQQSALLRAWLWEHAGLERDAGGLSTCLDKLEAIEPELAPGSRAAIIHQVGTLVTTAALTRAESRGAHERTDRPGTDPAQARRQLVRAPAIALTPIEVSEPSTPTLAAAGG